MRKGGLIDMDDNIEPFCFFTGRPHRLNEKDECEDCKIKLYKQHGDFYCATCK